MLMAAGMAVSWANRIVGVQKMGNEDFAYRFVRIISDMEKPAEYHTGVAPPAVGFRTKVVDMEVVQYALSAIIDPQNLRTMMGVAIFSALHAAMAHSFIRYMLLCILAKLIDACEKNMRDKIEAAIRRDGTALTQLRVLYETKVWGRISSQADGIPFLANLAQTTLRNVGTIDPDNVALIVADGTMTSVEFKFPPVRPYEATGVSRYNFDMAPPYANSEAGGAPGTRGRPRTAIVLEARDTRNANNPDDEKPLLENDVIRGSYTFAPSGIEGNGMGDLLDYRSAKRNTTLFDPTTNTSHTVDFSKLHRWSRRFDEVGGQYTADLADAVSNGEYPQWEQGLYDSDDPNAAPDMLLFRFTGAPSNEWNMCQYFGDIMQRFLSKDTVGAFVEVALQRVMSHMNNDDFYKGLHLAQVARQVTIEDVDSWNDAAQDNVFGEYVKNHAAALTPHHLTRAGMDAAVAAGHVLAGVHTKMRGLGNVAAMKVMWKAFVEDENFLFHENINTQLLNAVKDGFPHFMTIARAITAALDTGVHGCVRRWDRQKAANDLQVDEVDLVAQNIMLFPGDFFQRDDTHAPVGIYEFTHDFRYRLSGETGYGVHYYQKDRVENSQLRPSKAFFHGDGNRSATDLSTEPLRVAGLALARQWMEVALVHAPITITQVNKWEKENWLVPFTYLLARPFMTYTMSDALYSATGGVVGKHVWQAHEKDMVDVDYQHGNMVWSAIARWGTVIHSEEFVGLFRGASSKGCVTGARPLPINEAFEREIITDTTDRNQLISKLKTGGLYVDIVPFDAQSTMGGCTSFTGHDLNYSFGKGYQVDESILVNGASVRRPAPSYNPAGLMARFLIR
jgi:hypothetical protein